MNFFDCTDLEDVGGTARQSECRYTELTGKYGTEGAANAEAERRARFCAANQPPDPNEIPW